MKKVKHPNYGLVYTFCGLHIFYRLKWLIERKKKNKAAHDFVVKCSYEYLFLFLQMQNWETRESSGH